MHADPFAIQMTRRELARLAADAGSPPPRVTDADVSAALAEAERLVQARRGLPVRMRRRGVKVRYARVHDLVAHPDYAALARGASDEQGPKPRPAYLDRLGASVLADRFHDADLEGHADAMRAYMERFTSGPVGGEHMVGARMATDGVPSEYRAYSRGFRHPVSGAPLVDFALRLPHPNSGYMTWDFQMPADHALALTKKLRAEGSTPDWATDDEFRHDDLAEPDADAGGEQPRRMNRRGEPVRYAGDVTDYPTYRTYRELAETPGHQAMLRGVSAAVDTGPHTFAPIPEHARMMFHDHLLSHGLEGHAAFIRRAMADPKGSTYFRSGGGHSASSYLAAADPGDGPDTRAMVHLELAHPEGGHQVWEVNDATRREAHELTLALVREGSTAHGHYTDPEFMHFGVPENGGHPHRARRKGRPRRYAADPRADVRETHPDFAPGGVASHVGRALRHVMRTTDPEHSVAHELAFGLLSFGPDERRLADFGKAMADEGHPLAGTYPWGRLHESIEMDRKVAGLVMDYGGRDAVPDHLARFHRVHGGEREDHRAAAETVARASAAGQMYNDPNSHHARRIAERLGLARDPDRPGAEVDAVRASLRRIGNQGMWDARLHHAAVRGGPTEDDTLPPEQHPALNPAPSEDWQAGPRRTFAARYRRRGKPRRYANRKTQLMTAPPDAPGDDDTGTAPTARRAPSPVRRMRPLNTPTPPLDPALVRVLQSVHDDAKAQAAAPDRKAGRLDMPRQIMKAAKLALAGYDKPTDPGIAKLLGLPEKGLPLPAGVRHDAGYDPSDRSPLASQQRQAPSVPGEVRPRQDVYTRLGVMLRAVGHPLADALNWHRVGRGVVLDHLVENWLAQKGYAAKHAHKLVLNKGKADRQVLDEEGKPALDKDGKVKTMVSAAYRAANPNFYETLPEAHWNGKQQAFLKAFTEAAGEHVPDATVDEVGRAFVRAAMRAHTPHGPGTAGMQPAQAKKAPPAALSERHLRRYKRMRRMGVPIRYAGEGERMPGTKEQLEAHIRAKPRDTLAPKVYADWLQENGEDLAGHIIREGAATGLQLPASALRHFNGRHRRMHVDSPMPHIDVFPSGGRGVFLAARIPRAVGPHESEDVRQANFGRNLSHTLAGSPEFVVRMPRSDDTLRLLHTIPETDRRHHAMMTWEQVVRPREGGYDPAAFDAATRHAIEAHPWFRDVPPRGYVHDREDASRRAAWGFRNDLQRNLLLYPGGHPVRDASEAVLAGDNARIGELADHMEADGWHPGKAAELRGYHEVATRHAASNA